MLDIEENPLIHQQLQLESLDIVDHQEDLSSTSEYFTDTSNNSRASSLLSSTRVVTGTAPNANLFDLPQDDVDVLYEQLVVNNSNAPSVIINQSEVNNQAIDIEQRVLQVVNTVAAPRPLNIQPPHARSGRKADPILNCKSYF